MSYVIDVNAPSNVHSLRGFPKSLPDEEIRKWWARLCPGPVVDLPTAEEVAVEYAAAYPDCGSVGVVHRDGEGRPIDTGFFAREIR
jgi:hypothetical protein